MGQSLASKFLSLNFQIQMFKEARKGFWSRASLTDAHHS